MMIKFEVIAIIPCYNEGKKFLTDDYKRFLLENPDTLICFVNDGSKDSTIEILMHIQNYNSSQVEIVTYDINLGKAEAVRKGVLHCQDKFAFEYIGFLDADLSVSLEEFKSFKELFKSGYSFCFGSRIARVGSNIQRKRIRFLIGRFIATLISNILSIKVYDTQCGCKMFGLDVVNPVFSKPFISKWLFDVEIFFRIINFYGKEQGLMRMLEVPLLSWIDRGDSKVKMTYFFKLFLDLYQIKKKYSK